MEDFSIAGEEVLVFIDNLGPRLRLWTWLKKSCSSLATNRQHLQRKNALAELAQIYDRVMQDYKSQF